MSPEELRALDRAVQAGHEALRDWYSSWLFRSTIVVIIGCCMEIPEVLDELWPTLVPGRRKRGVKILSTMGLLLLIIGIAGELVFEDRSSQAEGTLQTFNEILLSDAQLKISEANQRAGEAKNSALQAASAASQSGEQAASAQIASRRAVAAIGNAVILAAGARKEADSFEKDIVSAKTKAADAESHLAEALKQATAAQAQLNALKSPRTFLNFDNLVKRLADFKGTKYGFSGVFGDEESIELLKTMDRMLQQSGWSRVSLPDPYPAVHPYGALDSLTVSVNLSSGVTMSTDADGDIKALLQLPTTTTLPQHLQAGIVLFQGLAANLYPPQTLIGDKAHVSISKGDTKVIKINIGKKP